MPKHWTRAVQATLIRVMALAQYALVYTRSRATQSDDPRLRLTQRDQLEQEIEFPSARRHLPRLQLTRVA